jgi:branched-chain amino acid aminotransferase
MGSENVYLNGRIVPAGQAAIGVFDEGFLHGATVFTTMRAHNGVVFRLPRHLGRLAQTAGLLGLNVQAEPAALTKAVADILAANQLREARVRITLSPGVREAPTTLVTAQPLTTYPRGWYEKGIQVVVSSYRQGPGDPTVGHKTGCYLTRVLARQEAAAKGAEEALWYTPDNRLAEACFCNVFLALDGEVLTPPRDTPVLPGIVREAVIELCGRMDIPCRDSSPLTVRQMLSAQEMFLTASLTGVRPVCRVEGHDVGDGLPGELTKRIMTGYQQLLDAECAG